MIHYLWLFPAFFLGGLVAHIIIEREYLRRLADGRLVDTVNDK